MRPSLWLPLVIGIASIACSNEENPPASAAETNTPPPPTKPPSTGPEEKPSPPNNPAEDANAAPCTGAAGEIYALSAKKLAAEEEIPLCRWKGKVMLILNGASKCGQTYQYTPLQALYSKYQEQGLEVLAFPSRDFAQQEFENDAETSAFCTEKYGVKFPLFTIAPVTGANIQPVFKWLTSQPGYETPIPWNFEKFLINRQGKIVKRFAYNMNPDPTVDPTIENAIKAELAKP